MDLNLLEFTNNYLKEYFNRNKKLIIISCLLMLISIILGIIFSDVIYNFIMDVLKELIGSFNENNTIYDEMYLIFVNNIKANIIVMLGGLLFCLISVFAVIFNGLIIGFTYTLVSPIQFFVGIFPHGIFELPAIILSLVNAFNIMKLEVNLIDAFFKGNLRLEWNNSEKLIQDIIFTFLLVFILLVIAAIIEGGITPILLGMVS